MPPACNLVCPRARVLMQGEVPHKVQMIAAAAGVMEVMLVATRRVGVMIGEAQMLIQMVRIGGMIHKTE